MSKKAFLVALVAILVCQSVLATEGAQTVFAEANAAEGRALWKTDLEYYWVSSPIVAGNLVFTSSFEYGGPSGNVYCFNGSDGEIIWQLSAGAAEFTVSNGYIYIAHILKGPLRQGGNLTCLNASTGALIWSFISGYHLSKPIVEEGVVYFGSISYTYNRGGLIYALNASTGTQLWCYNGPASSDFQLSSMVLDENHLCATGTDGVYALDPTNGSLQWRHATTNLRSISSQNGTVFTSRYDNNTYTVTGEVNAFKEQTGEKIWSYSADITKINHNNQYEFMLPISVPIVTQNAVYIAAQNGDVTAIKTGGGQKIWQTQLNDALWQEDERPTSPAVGDDKVFVSSQLGIYCIDANEGNLKWQFNQTSPINTLTSHPAYADGVVYVGGTTEYFRSSIMVPAVLVALKTGSSVGFSVLQTIIVGVTVVLIVVSLAAAIMLKRKKRNLQNRNLIE